MKKYVYLALALVLCFAALAAADEEVIIGSPASGNYVPWWGSNPEMRFQCLWEKSEIGLTAGGYINKVEFNRSSSASGSFGNVRVYFGHSTKTTELDLVYANNYSDTPVQVLNETSVTVAGSSGQWWDLGITPNTFNYNNTDNLVMEIRWSGGGTSCPCYRASGTNKRIWAFDDEATTAVYRYAQLQYIRLTVANTTGVAPTSLGRIKSLYN
ncbi:MAG: hypothetical protein PVH29_07475 [Candidatus Zixiibacteriota bacterium]|jgi:hypothetical protein